MTNRIGDLYEMARKEAIWPLDVVHRHVESDPVDWDGMEEWIPETILPFWSDLSKDAKLVLYAMVGREHVHL